ncbi:hypothetical protein GGX14DRAFT_380251 [Mycena pura]|uniref:Uncharacterized protein n=1 Tax=Mycena pura TaxID=153505 RepID=A0AAD6UQM4_9AGAR|nr:hypothetical protein GGX14DRAFT_380251 [Mycena pura]
MSSQLYSQGFSFSSFIQKGVDPRTGQYTCAITIYESPSKARNCPPLQLSISYNPMSSQNIGLGNGWAFNLSSYQHRQSNNPALLLSTGEHYQVTETSSLASVNDQKLKSFQFVKISDDDGTYQVTHKSGIIELLSNASNTYNTTVPIEIYAASGRSLKLVWDTWGETPRLTTIQDGDENLLVIDYNDSGADITRNPNTAEASTFTLAFANDQLSKVKLPLEDGETVQSSWTFTYETFDNEGITCLSTVTSPIGLLEEVQYKEQGHQLPSGAPYAYIPYVISHTARPGNQQPAIETTYSFSDHNFLGYGGCNDWKDGQDNLYRVPDDYQYASTVQVTGGTLTQYTYNKFHLVFDTQQQQGTKQVTQSITSVKQQVCLGYQPAQYQLPKTVQVTYLDTATNASRVQTSQHVFDEWGNPTQEITANGVQTDRVYYLAAGEQDCSADPSGFQRYMKDEIITPATSAFTTPTRHSHYTYQKLPAAAGDCPASYFVVAQEMQALEDGLCLSSTQLAYVNQPATRDHGRTQKTTTTLAGQYPKTQEWTYSYPTSAQLKEAVQTIFFDGLTVQEESTSSLFTGTTISHRDPAGNLALFTHDRIGRQIKHTVASGTPYEATRQQEYAIVKDGDGNAIGASITITDPKGVQKRYTTDGMERLLRAEGQDDDGQYSTQGDVTTYSGTFRVVEERSYNAQTQCVQVAVIDWLRGNGDAPTEQRDTQALEYDDWGQRCKVTDSSGLVTCTTADPISLTHTEGIQGEGKTQTQLNEFGLPIQKSLLRADGSVYSQQKYTYDGIGRLIQHKDVSGNITGKQFSHDSFDRITQTAWPNDHKTNSLYAPHTAAPLPASIGVDNGNPFATQVFDGLDRVIKRTISGRTTTQSYQDTQPEPAGITTPKGDTSSLTYNPALQHVLTSWTGSDASYSYQYDSQRASMTQFNDAHGADYLEYLPSGLLSTVSVTEGGETLSAQSTYSMAGRLVCYTDINGNEHKFQYDQFGRPQLLTEGELRVAFNYDTANRLSVACATDGGSNASLTTSLKYDEFGREIQRTVVQSGDSDTTLYQLSQTYDSDGSSLVATRDVKDGNTNLLRHEGFEYDSLGRLVDYQCSGSDSWLPADEKGKKLKRQQFTFDNYDSLTQVLSDFQDGTNNTATYTYSDKDPAQLAQITNTNSNYTPQINLIYDANGCLTQDEQGRLLEYDSKSRLIAVRDANKNTLSQYRYDAAGKLVCQMVPGQADTHLSYRGDTLIATTDGDSQVSYACTGNTYWGKTTAQSGQTTETELWSSDFHQSVLATLTAGEVAHQQYTPYGFGASGSSAGFNGQWRDPVTGWYHLGNGYRVYNPVLMRFHTPDSWSPFTSKEINAYGYCLGDPINLIDPSGHFSIFGIHFGGRDLAIMGVGLGVGILVGVLTCGVGLAVAVGVSVLAGALSDMATGAIYDLATGKTPTKESMATDALYGAIGGLVGEGIGRVIGKGVKVLARGVSRGLGRSGSLAITGSAEHQAARLVSLDHETLHPTLGGTGIHVFDSLGGQPGHAGLLTHGLPDSLLHPSGVMRRPSFVARDVVLPALNKLQPKQPGMQFRPIFTLLACNSFPHTGREFSRVLGCPVRCFAGSLKWKRLPGVSLSAALHGLETEHGLSDAFVGFAEKTTHC